MFVISVVVLYHWVVFAGLSLYVLVGVGGCWCSNGIVEVQ